MFKLLIACLLCSSAALLDPPRAFSFVDAQAQYVGAKIKGVLDIKQIFPGLKR